MTQKDIAERAGVAPSYLTRWKKDDRRGSAVASIMQELLARSWKLARMVFEDGSRTPLGRRGAAFLQLKHIIHAFLSAASSKDGRRPQLMFLITYYRVPGGDFPNEDLFKINAMLDQIISQGQVDKLIVGGPPSAIREAIVGAFLELVHMHDVQAQIDEQLPDGPRVVDYGLLDVLATMERLVKGFAVDPSRVHFLDPDEREAIKAALEA